MDTWILNPSNVELRKNILGQFSIMGLGGGQYTDGMLNGILHHYLFGGGCPIWVSGGVDVCY